MKMIPVSLLALTLSLLIPQAFASDSLRCSGGLIMNGDSKYKLLEKCGQPDYIDYDSFFGIEDRWIYEGGSNRDRVIISIPSTYIGRIDREYKRP